jgi:type IV pilus assembly protein PilM
MATLKTVWGIDIGQCALKALKLRFVEDQLRLEAFDIIEHPKVLTQPDADKPRLIRLALEQFLARNNVEDSLVVVSAPGQTGFTRFVKLPPVEEKQIPEIVRFEAEQQIPFNINDVIWRWQAFHDPDSPDVEVGIFAMKRTDVTAVLDRYAEAGISVDIVQMAPLALYNFLSYDDQQAPDGATLLVDIGADKTDLVIADGSRIWTRTLQLGGNNFTESLVKAFKLSFGKAEKLKRMAATNKHARHIFQAMRPVFAELVQEIQRSIGYYSSLHRESRFKKVVGLGNGFRLPGLQKFLEQNLGIPVSRIDSFNKLSPSAVANAPALTENVLSFAVAYGLALQGLELTRIRTNLLPQEISSQRHWSAKQPWFAAAALLAITCCGGVLWGMYRDKSYLEGDTRLTEVQAVIKKYGPLVQIFKDLKGKDLAEEQKAAQYFRLLADRQTWPVIDQVVSNGFLRAIDPRQQGLLRAEKLAELKAIPREQRRVIVMESQKQVWMDDLSKVTAADIMSHDGGASGGAPMAMFMPGMTGAPGAPAATTAPAMRGYILYIRGSTPMNRDQAIDLIQQFRDRVWEAAKDYPAQISIEQAGISILPAAGVEGRPAGMAAGFPGPEAMGTPGAPGAPDAKNLDSLTGEPVANDTHFVVGWVVAVKGEGPPEQVYKALTAQTGGAK